jgi:SIR2-like domain
LKMFLEYKRDLTGQEVVVNEVDFEEVISFLDMEHYLGLRGSDTWSQEGNESQLQLKWCIGKLLSERLADLVNLPKPYLRFAESLRPGDVVLTFNYDSLLERSLELTSQPFRLFPDRYSHIDVTTNEIDPGKAEIVILKLHGSADWFNRSSYDERLEVAAQAATTATIDYVPSDPIFGPDRIVEPIPLVDGPRSSNDPLNKIFRVPDPGPLYESRRRVVPFILSPSYSKIIYAAPLLGFWHGLGKGAAWHLGMALIGFSLPAHDEYVRQALYSLTRDYTESWWGDEFFGKHKLPLRIVDFRSDEQAREELRERYRFVDWSRTEAFYEGFSDEAVEFLFREPHMSKQTSTETDVNEGRGASTQS